LSTEEKQYDILTRENLDDIIAKLVLIFDELPALGANFLESVNGLTLDQIMKSKEAMKIIELIYIKSAGLSANGWCLYKLSMGIARPATSEQEWNEYTSRVLKDMKHD
jgi:hypothetical protein